MTKNALLHPTRRGLLMAGGAGLPTAALPGYVGAQAAPGPVAGGWRGAAAVKAARERGWLVGLTGAG